MSRGNHWEPQRWGLQNHHDNNHNYNINHENNNHDYNNTTLKYHHVDTPSEASEASRVRHPGADICMHR